MKPIKKFVAPPISAAIWDNQIEKENKIYSIKTITIERNYKDDQGNWKSTTHYRLTDLPKINLVVRKAFAYLALHDDTPTTNKKEEPVQYDYLGVNLN